MNEGRLTTRGSYPPSKSQILHIATATQPFFACLVKCFIATLCCSDFEYGEIFSIPIFHTQCLNSSQKKSYEVLNLDIFGSSVVSPQQLVTWLCSLIFTLFLNPFPLSNFDETSYIFILRWKLGFHFFLSKFPPNP